MNLPCPPVLRRNRLVLIVRALLLVLLAGPAAGFAQSPSLTHTSPGALVPGKTQELTVHGANLSGATNLWTGFGAKIFSSSATNASAAKFHVSLPADATVGIYALRVASAGGVSMGYAITLGDNNEIVEIAIPLSGATTTF